ncbi:MAG: hypothetical protein WB816_00160 [Methylocystis sp.]
MKRSVVSAGAAPTAAYNYRFHEPRQARTPPPRPRAARGGPVHDLTRRTPL